MRTQEHNDIGTFEVHGQNVVIKLHDRVCETPDEILSSRLSGEVLKRAVERLVKRNSVLLDVFENRQATPAAMETLIKTLGFLVKMPRELVPNVVPGSEGFLRDPHLFNDFIEYVYNFWRSFDRFIISDATGKDYDKRPYRAFNATIGQLTHLIRGIYRDVQENVMGSHPRIYRQVPAGAEVSTIAATKNVPWKNKGKYEALSSIPFIRQIFLFPPLILNPPMNKRTGKFERIETNPLDLIKLNPSDWLCYPAKVGSLVIFIYFHTRFSELGHALCNLFQLAEDEDLERQPDAVYFYGVPGNGLDNLGVFPTVFFEDADNGLFVAAIPGRDEFGYFGYIKKMVLTLHNIIMMKRGRLPFHGAFVRIILKGNREANILFVGDTGAGKSETLEAFRELGEAHIQDIFVIADDMGSLAIDQAGDVIGYGTEIGAFLRLDDLQPGYALGQIDRAIIMSPNQVNARIILPVTTFETIIKGHKLDYILYANNYDEIDEEHKIIERFDSLEQALMTFREGTVMSKGTTTSTGLVHSYFANIFGPPQYKDLHEPLARKFFEAFIQKGIFIGQVRTRLGLMGWEREGPLAAARELLALIQDRKG